MDPIQKTKTPENRNELQDSPYFLPTTKYRRVAKRIAGSVL